MKFRTIFLLGVCLIMGLPTLANATIRIAYSSDGNQHDADDWHSSPMALALVAYAGSNFRMVHFDYNNHLGDNSDWRAQTHHKVVMEAVNNYGYDKSIIFNDQWDVQGAVNSIARAINASSASDRLYLVCAGPMEVCWRGINAAQDNKEQYVTVISHSAGFNDNHADTPQMNHIWADIRDDFDVRAQKIQDQNQTAFRSDPSQWTWLRELQYGNWFYSAVAEGRKAGDASDAGMVYWILDGRTAASEWPSMSDIRARFNGSAGSEGGASGGSAPETPAGWVNLRGRGSSKCLEVAGWSDANGGNVRQWNCNGNANQAWRMEDSWGGRQVVQARHSNKCLDVERRATHNGANARQWYCHTGEGQQYAVQSTGGGWFMLRAKHSNKCLTIENGAGWNGANVQQWNCHGGWNQQFRAD